MRVTSWGRKRSKMAEGDSVPALSSRVSGKSPEYMSTLAPEDRKRYKEKLQVSVAGIFVAFKSPYDVRHDHRVWSDSPSTWPNFSYGDLYSYLNKSPGPFTREKLKAYKSLEAYDYFVSRKVGAVSSFKGEPSPSGYVMLKADVRPGQAESAKDSHLAWVICKKSGEVIVGHCDCKPGLGETCSHVAALLFKVEVGVRIGLTKTSCTSEACRWNQVFGISLTAPVMEIDFKPSGKRKETRPRESCQKAAHGPLACSRGDEGYLEAYSGVLEELKSICPAAVVFKSLPCLDPEETDTANSQTDYKEVDSTDHTTGEEMDVSFEVHDLLNPRPPASYVNKFLEWGRQNEEVALQVYKGLVHLC